MNGKDIINLADEKAIKWNHGSIPEIGIRHIFLVNELEDKMVFTRLELEKIFHMVKTEEAEIDKILRQHSCETK